MTVFKPRLLIRAAGCALGAFVLLAAGQLSAADLALVLGNADYRRLGNARGADDLRPIARDLANEGFDVIAVYDGKTSDLLEGANRFHSRARDADRILILMDGHFVSSDTDAWLLGTDAEDVDVLNAPSVGLSLSALAEVAGKYSAGRAVILAGTSGGLAKMGDGLRTGTQGLQLPQGVTLARGTAEAIRTATFDGLLRRQASLNEALAALSARGFLSSHIGFSGADRVNTEQFTARAQEDGFWEAARALNTEQALRLYIQRYPGGRFVSEANDRISALANDQQNSWEQAENDLNLTREDRRRVQRDLTLLGYDTRGIDGIFGGGTRAAIARWQRDRGHEVTNFLDRRQLRQITNEATQRRDQQEAEERRAEEQYWRQNGSDGKEAGLRAYLQRYPNGRFADQAKRQLAEIEAAREEESRREERTAWNRAQETDTIAAYSEFVDKYPTSRFADRARKRIRELRDEQGGNETDALMETARQQEAQIINNPVTMLLVERRLQQLGYDPGPADANFDEQTRRAIRAFQGDNGIFQSGYVTNRTASFLLAGR